MKLLISKKNAFAFVASLLLCNSLPIKSFAQTTSTEQVDAIDIFKCVLKRLKIDTTSNTKISKTDWAILPIAGYTTNNGFVGSLAFSIGIQNQNPLIAKPKISSILTNINYTSYRQTIIPLQANIWSKNENYNYNVDWKYVDYPSYIWGFKETENPETGMLINFSSIKLHQSILKRVYKNWYLGAGYYFDSFWNVYPKEELSPTENKHFNEMLNKKSTSSSLVFRVMYDSRENQINSKQGSYLSATLRNSAKAYGSNENWNSLSIDYRKYVNFPRNSQNTLAFWLMGWYNTAHKSPYFLLPSSGWDDAQNTARGTMQGRYRGAKMNYLETEYRFGILKNGLLGAVLFANAQTFPEQGAVSFKNPYLGAGFGFRVKINKRSSTNICLDFGFGQKRSINTNVGEVF